MFLDLMQYQPLHTQTLRLYVVTFKRSKVLLEHLIEQTKAEG